MPASVHTALISAPEAPGSFSAIFAKSIPLSPRCAAQRRIWSARAVYIEHGAGEHRSQEPWTHDAAMSLCCNVASLVRLS